MEGLDLRVSTLEKAHAATDSKIDSLMGGVKELKEAFRDNAKTSRPNLVILGTMGIALVGLFLTIGTLAFAPVYKDNHRQDYDIDRVETRVDAISSNRFTSADGDDLAIKMEAHSDRSAGKQSERIYRNEEVIFALVARVSALEGKNDD